MGNSNTSNILTLVQRIKCLLAVTDSEAEIILRSGRTGVDTSAIGRRVGLSNHEVDSIISSENNIRKARIDPNKITQAQLHQIPGLDTSRIRLILDGRPFFSLREFEEASELSSPLVDQIFNISHLEFVDKITGKNRTFEPIFGKYIAKPELDFVSSEDIERIGFIEYPTKPGAKIRVLTFSDEERPKKIHDLKHLMGGQIFPILTDNEGFERYFLPAFIDIWFLRDVSKQRALEITSELGLKIHSFFLEVGLFQVELCTYPNDFHVTSATLSKISEIQKYEEVEFAEPSETGFEEFEPENERILPDFEDASSGSRVWNLEAIEINNAHKITEGSPEVTIIVVDSGIDPDHQDLNSSLRPDWNLLDLNFDVGVPEEILSPLELAVAHGTKVSSVAVGRGPVGGSRVRGIAPKSWLLPVKISGSPFEQSYGLRAAAIKKSLDYISENERAIINISWTTNGEHLGIRQALSEASNKGFAITTSAGNYKYGETQVPDKLHYPSKYAFLQGDTIDDVNSMQKIMGLASVASVNSFNKKASYSYYGYKSITVSAPGGEPGLSGEGIYVASTPIEYVYEAGTSFASPHLAGLIALIWSVKPDLSAQEAIEIVQNTATNIDADNPNFSGMLGSGLINAQAALSALELNPTPTPEEPSSDEHDDSPRTDSSDLIDINSASQGELESLPLIGNWSAVKIVEYRNTNGPFETIWDLTKTGAVDNWTIEQIKHLITANHGINSHVPELNGVILNENSSIQVININLATVEQLLKLPMIGNWSAVKIVEYRDTNGPFETIWDLTKTGAVDNWTIEQIKHLITTV